MKKNKKNATPSPFNSLFMRLTFSFLVIVLLTGVTGFFVTTAYHKLSLKEINNDISRRFDEKLSNIMFHSAETALKIYLLGGPEQYSAHIKQVAEKAQIRVSIIGPDSMLLSGAAPSPNILDYVKQVPEKQGIIHQQIDQSLIAIKHLTTKDNKKFTLISFHTFIHPSMQDNKHWPPPPPRLTQFENGFAGGKLPLFLQDKTRWIQLFSMLLVVAIICFLLARTLTKPIRKMQKISRKIADGDFSARIGADSGGAGTEIAALGKDFDLMAEKTENLITSQRRLLIDISHELRSPLARLNVALEMTRQQHNLYKDRLLDRISLESERINELIDELLLLARLEIPETRELNERIDILKLLSTIAKDVEFEASNNFTGVTISGSESFMVQGNRRLLHRGIENILRNCVRYTTPGTGVKINLTQVSKTSLNMDIIDNGPGVPEKDLPHIFRPFYRVSESRDRQSGGTGLGLSIARQAIEFHGGHISASNHTESNGLCITVILPVSL